MVEMIRQIPGPMFLLLYGVVIALGIVIGRKWIDADGSEGYSMPDFARYDPISLAFLKGGVNEVIRTAIFMLTEKKLVEIETELNRSVLKVRKESRTDLHRLENEVYITLLRDNIKYPTDLFKSKELQEKLQAATNGLNDEFVRAQLLRGQEGMSRARMKKTATIILILTLGLTKLTLGLTHHKPVAFLVILMIIAAILLLVLLRVTSLSKLGKRYVTGLEQHFAWLRNELVNGKEPAGIDPALAMVIFGAGSLYAVGQYQAFASAFPSTQSGDGSSSGCGGSDGGGSDGGGGGCGGCGGGGGD